MKKKKTKPLKADPMQERARALADRALTIAGMDNPIAAKILCEFHEAELLSRAESLRVFEILSFDYAVMILEEFAEDARNAGRLL